MEDKVLQIILYFDIFSYPLKKEEIISFTRCSHNDEIIVQALNSLEKQGIIEVKEGYCYVGDPAKVERRKQGNIMARKRMKSAIFFSRIISWFPYVKGVMLSGSISKGYMGEKDDIDYFIVTQPGRLWTVRTFLTLFKKLFLLNSYRNFCINFFVDTDNMSIKERTRYAATEIVFLLPVFKSSMYNKMLIDNSWVKQYYPEFEQAHTKCMESEIWIKKWIEKILLNKTGDKLEDYLFKKSASYIRRKFSNLDAQSFGKSFTLKRNELRYFPEHMQIQVAAIYLTKCKEYEERFGITISGNQLINHAMQ